MPNDAELQEILKSWNEGKPVRVLAMPNVNDQAKFWGVVFSALANQENPRVLENSEAVTARETIKAIQGHGWRKTVQIHVGQEMPAIEITNPAAHESRG